VNAEAVNVGDLFIEKNLNIYAVLIGEDELSYEFKEYYGNGKTDIFFVGKRNVFHYYKKIV